MKIKYNLTPDEVWKLFSIHSNKDRQKFIDERRPLVNTGFYYIHLWEGKAHLGLATFDDKGIGKELKFFTDEELVEKGIDYHDLLQAVNDVCGNFRISGPYPINAAIRAKLVAKSMLEIRDSDI